jgi:hypothetical protein
MTKRQRHWPCWESESDEVECEVCGEAYPNERSQRRWTKVSWIKDSQGRDEGIDHCKTCTPNER